MDKTVLSISRDYSPSPAGRYKSDGPYNGTRFRDDVLIPQLKAAIERGGKLIVDFSGADSYSSSFLEEVFGGLVRARAFDAKALRSALVLRDDDPVYAAFVADARHYFNTELKKMAN